MTKDNPQLPLHFIPRPPTAICCSLLLQTKLLLCHLVSNIQPNTLRNNSRTLRSFVTKLHEQVRAAPTQLHTKLQPCRAKQSKFEWESVDTTLGAICKNATVAHISRSTCIRLLKIGREIESEMLYNNIQLAATQSKALRIRVGKCKC